MSQCEHHPEETDIRRGSYSCPSCGWYVVAGCNHPVVDQYAPVDTMDFSQDRTQQQDDAVTFKQARLR